MPAHRTKSRRTLKSPNDPLLVLLPAMLKPLGPPTPDCDQLIDLFDHVLRDFTPLDGIEKGTAAKVQAIGCLHVVQATDVGLTSSMLTGPYDDLDGVQVQRGRGFNWS